jgi:signal peptidase I
MLKQADPRPSTRASILTILIAIAVALGVRTFVAESFVVQGYSMLPTLHNGDRVLVNKLAFVAHGPRTGEIIVFQSPEIPSQDWIKRVIGVPGDTVSITNDVVYINGKRYPEPFLAYRHSINVARTKIPAGYVWVLGDNRPDSNDSRYWGALSESRIVGRAVLQWWPLNDIHWLP